MNFSCLEISTTKEDDCEFDITMFSLHAHSRVDDSVPLSPYSLASIDAMFQVNMSSINNGLKSGNIIPTILSKSKLPLKIVFTGLNESFVSVIESELIMRHVVFSTVIGDQAKWIHNVCCKLQIDNIKIEAQMKIQKILKEFAS